MQNNKPKISIIMPVYNVEKYLERSIESILKQSFVDFELYLVDDGSTDDSGTICDKYAASDGRINVIHQKNQGAHAARNNALKVINSDYVCFFDSDDYIEPDMLHELYDITIKTNSDLIVTGFYIHTYFKTDKYITQDYFPYIKNNNNIETYDDKDSFRAIAYKNFDRNMFYPPWNKMYKTKYLRDNNITFPNTYRDDFPFVVNVIKDISNVTYVKKQYYHFIRQRSESETQKFFPKLYEKREEEHQMMLDLYKYWGLSDDADATEMISRRYIDRIIECIVNLYNKECKLSNIEKENIIKKYFNTSNYNYAIKTAKPKNLYTKLMYLPLRYKNIYLSVIMSRFINYVKYKNIKLFSILKINR